MAFQFHPEVKKHRQHYLKLLRVAHRLKKIPQRRETMLHTIKSLGSELTTSGVIWMRSKSKFVSDIARLAKFWSQTVVYKGCGNGKSFFFELVAIKAAVIEEEKVQLDASHTRAFKRFLLMIINMKNLVIIFTDNFMEDEIPKDLLSESPLLLNPVNPFQNLFEVCEDDFMATMSDCASVTLSRMRCRLTSRRVSAVFYPQNVERLNNAVSFRKACYSLQPPDSDLMPTVVFNSSWLQPVLSASSNYQKVESDPSGQLRHLLDRVVRLCASVVLCAEMEDLQASPVTLLEKFLQELKCRSLEKDSSNRDVQFMIYSNNLNSTISVSIDIVANFVDFD